MPDGAKSRSEFVAALRAMADDYEANEQLPVRGAVALTVFCDSLEEAQARSIEGMERRAGEHYIDFRKEYAPNVYVELSVSKAALYDAERRG